MPRSLQEEIQQTRPFPSIETEVLLSVLRTADHLGAAEARLLKTRGLSPSAYNVLRIVRGAGPDGLPCSSIGERMITRVPDVTRLVDRLVASEFVGRRRGSADRRVVRVYLEAAGAAVLADLDDPVEQLARKLLGPLGQDKLASLRDLLTELRDIPRDEETS